MKLKKEYTNLLKTRFSKNQQLSMLYRDNYLSLLDAIYLEMNIDLDDRDSIIKKRVVTLSYKNKIYCSSNTSAVTNNKNKFIKSLNYKYINIRKLRYIPYLVFNKNRTGCYISSINIVDNKLIRDKLYDIDYDFKFNLSYGKFVELLQNKDTKKTISKLKSNNYSDKDDKIIMYMDKNISFSDKLELLLKYYTDIESYIEEKQKINELYKKEKSKQKEIEYLLKEKEHEKESKRKELLKKIREKNKLKERKIIEQNRLKEKLLMEKMYNEKLEKLNNTVISIDNNLKNKKYNIRINYLKNLSNIIYNYNNMGNNEKEILFQNIINKKCGLFYFKETQQLNYYLKMKNNSTHSIKYYLNEFLSKRLIENFGVSDFYINGDCTKYPIEWLGFNKEYSFIVVDCLNSLNNDYILYLLKSYPHIEVFLAIFDKDKTDDNFLILEKININEVNFYNK